MTLAKISDRSVFAAPAAIACRNSTRNRSVGVPLQNGAILAPVRWCVDSGQGQAMQIWN